jgi:ATP-dependent DNA helicase RecG
VIAKQEGTQTLLKRLGLLSEGVYNRAAICHRDYADESSNATLAVFDDRMEIWNSGRLPPVLKIADLKKTHDSFPRNKLIARVLYACGLIAG